MTTIVILLSTIIVMLVIHGFYTKSQIRNLAKQLKKIRTEGMDKKVNVQLLNRDLENLSIEINEALYASKRSKVNSIQKENELKEMIANMSHDLRTPLTSIMGYIQLLNNPSLTQEEREGYLEIIEKRSRILRGLLNDFYELSLIDSIDYKMTLEKVNISRILEEVVLGKYTEFREKGLEPVINIVDDVTITCDYKALERIIENLLSNMIRYAHTRAEISLEKANNLVILTVRNDSAYKLDEDIDKLFDRFYKGDKSRGSHGTGLGLSIVKGLIERMNGQVSAEINHNLLSITCTFCYVNE